MLEVDGMVLPLGLLGMAQGLDLLLSPETGSSIGALDSAGAQRNQEYGIWMQLLSMLDMLMLGLQKPRQFLLHVSLLHDCALAFSAKSALSSTGKSLPSRQGAGRRWLR